LGDGFTTFSSMRIMTLFVFILLTIFGFFSCRTTQVLPTETEINQLILQKYFNTGDNVSVTTIDGNNYRFNIEAFEETKLSGTHNKIPYALIDDIKLYQDLSLAVVGIGLVMVILFFAAPF